MGLEKYFFLSQMNQMNKGLTSMVFVAISCLQVCPKSLLGPFIFQRIWWAPPKQNVPKKMSSVSNKRSEWNLQTIFRAFYVIKTPVFISKYLKCFVFFALKYCSRGSTSHYLSDMKPLSFRKKSIQTNPKVTKCNQAKPCLFKHLSI